MKYFFVFLCLLVSIFTFSSTCELQWIKDMEGNAYFAPGKMLISGQKLFVHGTNYIKVYNVSDPSSPMPSGSTEDLSGSCGDSNQCTFDIAMFKGDTYIFLSSKSSTGIRCYDLTTQTYACKGMVNKAQVNSIGVIKTQNKRYVVFPGGMNGLYYADFTNPPGGCQVVPYDLLPEIKHSAHQIITFEYAGKVYMGMVATYDPFTLYDVTNFPNVSTVFTTTDNAYDAAFYGGKVYINSRNNGLKIYNVPSGTLAGSYTNYNFSLAYGINVDANYIYLSLGNCQTTGGFEILDRNTLTSILDPDFAPNSCNIEVDFDIMGIEGSGSTYVFRSATSKIEDYKIVCGDYANLTLGSYSPTNVDPGTTFNLNIGLKNTGTLSVEGASGTLSTTHNKVTINTPNQNYGTIAPNQTVTRSHSITVAPDATAGPINFTLNVSTSNAGSYSFNFVVNINEPRAILTRTISKNSTTQSLDVTYTNTGNADFTSSFSLGLTSYTKGVSFNPSSNTFSNIQKNTSQTKNYPYTLSNNCTPLNFISLYAKENPFKSDIPEEERNVDLLSGTGQYPYIKRYDSSLSKNGTNYTLHLTLKNIGNASGNNISATLSADRTEVSWSPTNTPEYGQIPENTTKSNDFEFTVPDGTSGIVNFTAEIVSNEGCWVYTFAHDLADIQFQYIDEKHCGCGVHCSSDHPDIYEGTSTGPSCVEFDFKLKNNGTSTATNVDAYLEETAGNSNVTIDVNHTTYTLNSGQEGYNLSPSFSLYINDSFCSGDNSTCPKLYLRLSIPDFNFTKALTFTVKATSENPPPPPSSCNLSYKSSSLQITSDNNGDGKANPGETVQFTIEIQNTGGTDAPSVKGTISEDSSKADYITLGTSTANFGTIQAGKSVRNSTPFSFTLTEDAQTGTYYFPISISSSCSTSNFSSTIPISVYSSGGGTVTLSYQRYSVSGSSDSSYLEAGKEQTLYVTLKNDSTTALPTSQATLSSLEPKVQIKTQGSYQILAGRESSAEFDVFLDSSFTGKSIPFHIEVQNAIVSNPDFNVSVGEPPLPPPPPVQALSIPIIVHSKGANNTMWKTDVFLQNPSNQNQSLTLKLLKADSENQTPPQSQINLSPFASLTIKDILDNPGFPEFRGYSIAGLLIEFSSTTPPFASARIYNDQGDAGTYGQFIPSIPVSTSTRGTSGNIPAYLFGMVKNSKYRSNIGLANVSSLWNEIKITFIDSEGFSFGSPITKNLAPYNITQINDIASAAGLSGDVGAFTVKVESNTKVDFIAWGSVVDNTTGDASFINDQIQSYSKALIMGVAHAKGAVNTNWRTDLNVYNPASSNLTLRLTYYRYGYDGFTSSKRLDPIGPGGTMIIEDILSQFVGLSEDEAGFIIAYPETNVDKNPIISARTYNDLAEKGTYGQFVSGLDFEKGGILSGKKLYFSGISINENFRANLGILNGEKENANTVTVSLYSKEGDFVSSFQEYLQYPLTAIQINYNFLSSKFGIPSFDDYTIIVEGSGNTFAYISQVDNKTSDPIFILPSLR